MNEQDTYLSGDTAADPPDNDATDEQVVAQTRPPSSPQAPSPMELAHKSKTRRFGHN